jgi:hypothetical protein
MVRGKWLATAARQADHGRKRPRQGQADVRADAGVSEIMPRDFGTIYAEIFRAAGLGAQAKLTRCT